MTDIHPIPVDALDADIAILGRKGGGKTYTSKGIVERLLDMGRRVLVLDPLGVWAGLRTAADGESPGYPVAIFGGAAGDLPLEPAAAEPLARIIATENLPAVIDLSELSKGAQQGFLLAFLHELRRVNTEALTIVLEEADVFAPQNPQGDDSKQLHGEIDWIARRGRFKGFRLITITQRPARLSKDVLTQCATLIAHRLPAPQDREAVKAWVDGNGDREKSREVFDTLAGLDVGEAWVWAPEHDILGRYRFPRITTLDTSATPKAGEKRIEPKTLATVDLSGIRAALAAAEPAIANRRRVAPVEDIAAAEQRGYERGFAEGEESGMRRGLALGIARAQMAVNALRVDQDPGSAAGSAATSPGEAAGTQPAPKPAARAKRAGTAAAAAPSRAGTIQPAKQRILDALAWSGTIGEDAPERTMLAFIADASPASSAFTNNLGSLRTDGLIDYPAGGRVCLTQAGRERAAAPPRALTHEALMDLLAAKLQPAQMRILRALAGNFPKPATRAALADAIGASAASSAFTNNLGRLRSFGLITYPASGMLLAADRLFPGGKYV